MMLFPLPFSMGAFSIQSCSIPGNHLPSRGLHCLLERWTLRFGRKWMWTFCDGWHWWHPYFCGTFWWNSLRWLPFPQCFCHVCLCLSSGPSCNEPGYPGGTRPEAWRRYDEIRNSNKFGGKKKCANLQKQIAGFEAMFLLNFGHKIQFRLRYVCPPDVPDVPAERSELRVASMIFHAFIVLYSCHVRSKEK